MNPVPKLIVQYLTVYCQVYLKCVGRPILCHHMLCKEKQKYVCEFVLRYTFVFHVYIHIAVLHVYSDVFF